MEKRRSDLAHFLDRVHGFGDSSQPPFRDCVKTESGTGKCAAHAGDRIRIATEKDSRGQCCLERAWVREKAIYGHGNGVMRFDSVAKKLGHFDWSYAPRETFIHSDQRFPKFRCVLPGAREVVENATKNVEKLRANDQAS